MSLPFGGVIYYQPRGEDMRKIGAISAVILLIISLTACSLERQPKPEYTLYSDTMLDSFNTLITVVGYTKTEAEFDEYFQLAQARFKELHRLYDIYNSYDGINNVKTINDMAGIEPVQVDQDLLALIILGKKWALTSSGKTNIALGPVLKIWHDYRTEGNDDPLNAMEPPRELLEQAAQYTDIEKVIIDEENSTIFLSDSKMSLDLGAIAKGYATELIAQELEAAGLSSGAINSGGNVRTIGQPLDGKREKWSVGIFDPDSTLFSENRDLDTVFVKNASVVSSGDYQRYYYVGGVRYHHLIDPATLWPGNYYRAVTVVTEDSGLADLYSTELFLLPYEESLALADSLDGVEAVWVMPDGEVRVTEGMKEMLRSHGATWD